MLSKSKILPPALDWQTKLKTSSEDDEESRDAHNEPEEVVGNAIRLRRDGSEFLPAEIGLSPLKTAVGCWSPARFVTSPSVSGSRVSLYNKNIELPGCRSGQKTSFWPVKILERVWPEKHFTFLGIKPRHR
jgi:hypothetical protein